MTTQGPAKLTLSRAINEGLRKAMENDPKVLIMGEDVGKLGGVFRVTDGLQKDFGEDRVIDTPLAESGIIGTAIGLALRGYRPVCEIQFDGFVFPAFDQIVSQLAKMAFRSAGHVKLPVVVRIPFGGGIGAVEHHSESPEVLFVHAAGLRVVACGDPADAYAMIQQSISCDDPVIFFEPKRRYWDKTEVDLPGGVAAALPIGRARTLVEGADADPALLRADGPHRGRGGSRGRRGRPVARSDRPAVAVAAGHRHDLRVGAQDRPLRRRARGPGDGRPRRRDRGQGLAGVLLLARVAGTAGGRLLDPVPAVTDRRALPARPGPGARCRRPRVHVLRGRGMSELKQFKLPDVGEGLTEADIVRWLVQPGDQVSINQIVVEIETAKSLVELPSPFEGVVADLLVPEGTTADVGTPILSVQVGSVAAGNEAAGTGGNEAAGTRTRQPKRPQRPGGRGRGR